MSFTGTRKIVKIGLGVVLLCCLLAGVGSAEQGTTLTVALEGVTPTGADGWLSLSLNGRFAVLCDGEQLGVVTANPSAEQLAQGQSDTLAIPADKESGLKLVPVDEDRLEGYDYQTETPVTVQSGTANRVTVFAYARRGLFSVSNMANGQPVGGAEFMVLDASGAAQGSFTVDETGLYTAQQPLPNGEYRLTQLRAAEGTLPKAEPVMFKVGTYTGKEADIALVTVENEPVPVHNGVTGVLAAEPSSFAVDGENGLTAELSVTGLCDGSQTLPLAEYRVTLGAGRLLTENREPLQEEPNVRITAITAEHAVSVQGLDASGKSAGDAVTAAAGESVPLTDAAAVQITYLDEKGETLLPAGQTAGGLRAALRYVPAEGLTRTPAFYALPVTADYSYQYPDVDGVSTVTAHSEVAPLTAEISIPDGRIAPVASAQSTAQGVRLCLTAEGLPADTPVAVTLEGGWAQADTVLRQPAGDTVLTTLGAAEDLSLAATASQPVERLTLWLLDPCTLPRTQDAPEGHLIRAQQHAAQPMLDLALGVTDGIYAKMEVELEQPLPATSSAPEQRVLAAGTLREDTAAAPEGLAVLLTTQTRHYGALTDALGAFTVWGAAEETQGILKAQLPRNATGAESASLALPAEGLEIAYARLCALAGTVRLDTGAPLAGARITLLQDGAALDETTTDALGVYRLEGLNEGAYQLAVLPAANAAMTAQTGDTVNPEGELLSAPLALTRGEERQVDFSAVALCGAAGELTQDGAPAEGLRVTLTDAQNNTIETNADAEGRYAFHGLKAGAYRLSVALPENVSVETLNGAKPELPDSVDFTLTAGEMREDSFTLKITASLTGAAPQLGAGAQIAVASLTAQLSAETDAQGAFSFTGLEPGDYTVYVPLPEGATVPEDSPWRVSERGDMVWLTLSLEAGRTYPLPETAFAAMTGISGVAFVDTNGDGVRTSDEQLMSGVPVSLRGESGELAATRTDDYGAYEFRDLEPGRYRVASQASGGLYVSAIGGTAALSEGWTLSDEQTLSEGDVRTLDIALAQPASVQAAAFSDSNGNGDRGEYERAISGVTVEVLSGDAAVASGITDASGETLIENIAPGVYTLRFTLPDGYLYTAKGTHVGLDSSCILAAEGSVALSEPITLSAGQRYQTAAAALPVGSLSGRVWNDLNNDGVMSEDEPGMAGVMLTVKGVKTGTERTLTTDETGVYRFALLRNDSYNLSAVLPEGTLFARYSPTGGDARSVFTVDGTTATRQFAVSGAEDVGDKNVGVIIPATLRGVAFMDLNYNGVHDEGEPPVSGVTLEAVKNSNDKSMGKVVSDENGMYSFNGLRGGDYRLRAILPNDGCTFTCVPQAGGQGANRFEAREGRRENTLASIQVNNGETVDTVVGVARGATLSGTAFQDSAYDGVLNGKDAAASGVKVQLLNEDGVVAATATTNAKGAYRIEGVMPGVYMLRFQRKNNLAYTRYRPNEAGGSHVLRLTKDGFGETESLTVEMGVDIADLNAGMLPSATVKGVLFDDLNDDGLCDEGEGGYVGATVRLLSGDGELDLTEPVSDDGAYFFDGVMPGDYTLTYQLPAHAEMACVTANGNTQPKTTTETFHIEMGSANEMPLAGAVTLGSLEGVAFHDSNANGVQDEGEMPIAGATLTLAPSRAGLEPAAVTTGADGAYALEALRPAEYKLSIQLPEGMIASHDMQGLTLTTENEQTLACPWSVLTDRANRGLGAVRPATLTGFVWLDENTDGAQAESERLLGGLRFELIDESTQRIVKTLSSDESGLLTIHHVRPGVYTVRFALPTQAEPAQDENSTFARKAEYMVQTGVTVAENETYKAIHCGLTSLTSIGGKVILQEGGARGGVEGVTIRLYQQGVAEPLQTVSTGSSGTYQFDGLWPGEYMLEAEQPAGMIFVRPEDEAYGSTAILTSAEGWGRSGEITLLMAAHQLQTDILFIRPGKVGDQAWLDENRNGLMDADEPMLNGVTVELLDAQGAVAVSTVTNEWGYYLLENVYPGTYTLRAAAYPELEPTTPVPALPMISSCLTVGDGKEATSEPFTVSSGSHDMDHDLGYVLKEGETLPADVAAGPVQDWTVRYAPEPTAKP